jgi:hypothetical protein
MNGQGTLIDANAPSAPAPTHISEEDMELLLNFQQDVAVSQRAYTSLMQQFAARYQLRDGDNIGKDRLITRKG